ncbi:MAG: FHA domain-containing protein [Xanthomonadales bacterium]|nr:FHA domain-containing protein [Xanthomonadales bacterium]
MEPVKSEPLAEAAAQVPRVDAVLEVHERSGALRERVRLDADRLRIGRALDNDLVLEDPYVCAHHAELHWGDEGWTLVDLNSVNGLRLADSHQRLDKIALAGPMDLRIGHTALRFRSCDEQIAAARKDPTGGRWSTLLARVPVALGAVVLAGLLIAFQQHLNQVQHREWLPAVAGSVGSVSTLVIWALAWALVNRVFAHRLNYPSHLSIGALSMIGALVASTLIEYVLFAFSGDGLEKVLGLLSLFGFLAVALWGHLRVISPTSRSRQALVAVSVSLLLYLVTYLPDQVGDDYSNDPQFSAILKPPAFQLTDGLSADHFYTRAAQLAAEVDVEAAEE